MDLSESRARATAITPNYSPGFKNSALDGQTAPRKHLLDPAKFNGKSDGGCFQDTQALRFPIFRRLLVGRTPELGCGTSGHRWP
jgi:hypothetical protein